MQNQHNNIEGLASAFLKNYVLIRFYNKKYHIHDSFLEYQLTSRAFYTLHKILTTKSSSLGTN